MRLWPFLILSAACAPAAAPAPVTAPASTETTPPEPPAPPPEPVAPPPLVSPDGVQILPCPDAPEDGMLCVAGGPFTRGFDGEHGCEEGEIRNAQTNHNPSATVWLQSYLIDVNEVTYAQYQACVVADGCKARKPNYYDFRRDDLPMTGTSWYESRDYCRFIHKDLPTEAQFERASRTEDGGLHPWGDDPADCAKAVIMDETGRGCGTPKSGSHPEKGRPLAVGSRPSYAGLHDMIGNAEEWVLDWYRPYKDCGDDCLGTDPKGPCAGLETCGEYGRKVVKGGSWYWGPTCATAANRRHHVPSNDPYHHFGFRCAKALNTPTDPP
ncbi:MAG: sulfatase modifying factor 1 [Kiritimatiellia bacterium]|jgi:sulfatase modifying factor 1